MGGYSGTRVARHTPIVTIRGMRFAVGTCAQRITHRALSSGGACFVKGIEVRAARMLERLGAGGLRDDGSFGRPGTNADGERWTFTLSDGVTVSPSTDDPSTPGADR